MLKAKPFVKWAGGKRQILSELKRYMPESYDCYYEPFVGGGALFFELSPRKAVINDYNSELINVYRVICDEEKYEKMCKLLNSYEIHNSEEFYYEIRNKDRNLKQFQKMSDFSRAARTIYLNKACFNGLYRVNSKNEFNVPYNGNKKVNTYDGENLLKAHIYFSLSDITLLNIDFEEAVKDAKKGDFVYFDPPYDSETSSFTSYTDSGFGKVEQERLARVYKELADRGVYVMLSNRNTTLIRELYKDYNIHVISAKRSINSNGGKRGKVEEVIITNYEPVIKQTNIEE